VEYHGACGRGTYKYGEDAALSYLPVAREAARGEPFVPLLLEALPGRRSRPLVHRLVPGMWRRPGAGGAQGTARGRPGPRRLSAACRLAARRATPSRPDARAEARPPPRAVPGRERPAHVALA